MMGSILVFIFSASQAVRDIFFSHLFENHGFFDVVLIVFISATLCGWIVLFLSKSDQLSHLRSLWKPLLLISVATAVGWMCYFFALTQIEPAIANTLFSGSGPFVVIVVSLIAGNGFPIYKRKRIELFCYAGLFTAMIAIVFVAVFGLSGLDTSNPWLAAVGSISAITSGTLIAVSLLVSRRLNEAGLTPNAIMAVRFLVGVPLALVVLFAQEQPTGIAFDIATLTVSAAALCFIVLPSYALQIGVSMASPLTVQVIVSLSPVIVFTAQLLDGRTHYSTATLICILTYGIFIVSANVLRGWKNDPLNKSIVKT